MTTTAHEDQFTAGTQTIQPVLQPYSTEAILRRNIADAEKEMQRQAERAESYAETLRSIASYVGAGGYNADTVDAGVFGAKIRWGIDEIMARTERAEAELAKLREQKPVAWMREDGNLYLAWQKDLCLPEVRFSPLYAVPAPAVADYGFNVERVQQAMHMLGLSTEESQETFAYKMDDNINRLTRAIIRHMEKLSEEPAVAVPAVPNDIIPEGDDFNGTTPHLIQCIESLVRLDAKGVLVPHGIGRDASKLLTAAANRLRQQAPAVPAEWREVMAELAADLQSTCDAEHPHRDQYPSVMRKYNNDMKIVEKARDLLQSAGAAK